MASIAFMAAATALTPAAAGAVTVATIGALATTAGGYLDATVVFPALAGGSGGHEILGPRIDDLPPQTSSEGSPISYVLGPQNRIAGTIIWKSDLIEGVYRGAPAGGKGGGGSSSSSESSVTKFSYSNHIAVGVCEGPIRAIRKIWADGKLIFDGGKTGAVDGVNIPGKRSTYYRVNFVGNKNRAQDNQALFFPLAGTIQPDGIVTPDFSEFIPGKDIVLSGFEHENNNGANFVVNAYYENYNGEQAIIFQRGKGPLTTIDYNTYTAGNWPEITVDQDVIDLEEEETLFFNQINIHKGDLGELTPTETDAVGVDSILATYAVGEHVPLYRDIAWVSFKNFQLRDFGNRMPSLTFLVEQVSTMTLGECVSNVMIKAGYSTSEFDVTGLVGDLHGLTMSGVVKPMNIIGPLMEAYGFVAQTVNNVITFVHSGNNPTFFVSEGDLAAHEESDEPPMRFEINEITSRDIPTHMNVAYTSPENSWERGLTSATRLDKTRNIPKTVEFPLTLNNSQAKTLAYRLLRTAWRENKLVNIVLPPSYCFLKEGDAITLNFEGEGYEVRIMELFRGDNLLVQIRGVIQRGKALQADLLNQQDAFDDDPDIPDDKLYFPPVPVFNVLDIPATAESQLDQVGYTMGMCASGSTDEWRGGTGYVARSEVSANWDHVVDITAESSLGITTNAVGDGPYGYIDRINEIRVNLAHGQLSSATLSEVAEGANICVIADELIGFMDVTFESATNEYVLKNLLRGLRGTEHEISGHELGETFTLLDSAIEFVSTNRSEKGLTKYFRATTVGGGLLDNDVSSFEFLGKTLRPFAPHLTTASYDGGDLVITWKPRTRSLEMTFSTYKPTFDGDDNYVIGLIDGSDDEYHTIDTTLTTYTISAATLSSVGTPVKIRVYQKSIAYGIGNYEEITV